MLEAGSAIRRLENGTGEKRRSWDHRGAFGPAFVDFKLIVTLIGTGSIVRGTDWARNGSTGRKPTRSRRAAAS